MLAICHLCYFMEFDNDDYVNQTINLPQSVMYTTPQNYFSESFFFFFYTVRIIFCLLFREKYIVKPEIHSEWRVICSNLKYR